MKLVVYGKDENTQIRPTRYSEVCDLNPCFSALCISTAMIPTNQEGQGLLGRPQLLVNFYTNMSTVLEVFHDSENYGSSGSRNLERESELVDISRTSRSSSSVAPRDIDQSSTKSLDASLSNRVQPREVPSPMKEVDQIPSKYKVFSSKDIHDHFYGNFDKYTEQSKNISRSRASMIVSAGVSAAMSNEMERRSDADLIRGSLPDRAKRPSSKGFVDGASETLRDSHHENQNEISTSYGSIVVNKPTSTQNVILGEEGGSTKSNGSTTRDSASTDEGGMSGYIDSAKSALHVMAREISMDSGTVSEHRGLVSSSAQDGLNNWEHCSPNNSPGRQG
jgi:hypothetical protein